MNNSLLVRIRIALKSTGKTEEQLEECLRENEIHYRLPYVENFAQPRDIYIVATFLQVPASQLFEATRYKDFYVRALFEETWPDYKDALGLPEEEVWEIVVNDWRRRGESPQAGIKQNLELILDGLQPPDLVTTGCQYPDCVCTGRCRTTGRMLEPGDWP